MKIAIVWYGKMWKLVEEYSIKRWHKIAIIIDPLKWTKLEDLLKNSFDIIIEFSIPEIALENMRFYAKNNMKVIMATTGWYNKILEIKSLFEKSNWALLWSWNFSLWVHIFWKIIEYSSRIFNKFEDYDIFWHEFHHNQKIDSPSGTLLNTAKIIIDNVDRKKSIVTEELKHRKINPDELHFSSTRWWNIPWIHQIYFDSLFDTIKIEHSARTRDWFALWAVVCAEWLSSKKWYFEINDFIKEII